MDAQAIVGMEALFATGKNDSSLTVREMPDGSFDVCGTHHRKMSSGFPSVEVTERTGLIFSFDAAALARSVFAEVGEQWFHHYRRDTWYRGKGWFKRTWSLRIESADGSIYRWEGADAAPHNLETVYEMIVAFGMPSLDAPRSENGPQFLTASQPREFSESGTRFAMGPQPGEFDVLTCYEGLIHDAREIEDEQDAERELQLLVEELVDDIGRYLNKVKPGLDLNEAFKVWGIEPSLRSLTEADVEGAPRVKMMALLGALTMVQDPMEAVKALQESGIFKRWCERLRVIPSEEDEARQRERVERHQALMLKVDDALRKHIGTGKVFTSYEVATEMGVTPTQVSGRIRRLVRAGELTAVGEGYPRRYKAA